MFKDSHAPCLCLSLHMQRELGAVGCPALLLQEPHSYGTSRPFQSLQEVMRPHAQVRSADTLLSTFPLLPCNLASTLKLDTLSVFVPLTWGLGKGWRSFHSAKFPLGTALHTYRRNILVSHLEQRSETPEKPADVKRGARL